MWIQTPNGIYNTDNYSSFHVKEYKASGDPAEFVLAGYVPGQDPNIHDALYTGTEEQVRFAYGNLSAHLCPPTIAGVRVAE